MGSTPGLNMGCIINTYTQFKRCVKFPIDSLQLILLKFVIQRIAILACFLIRHWAVDH